MKNQRFEQVSAPDGKKAHTDALTTIEPAPMPPRRYTYVLPNKARWAMEAAVANLTKAQEIMRAMRAWQEKQEGEMAQLEESLSRLSTVDRRVPEVIWRVRDIRLHLATMGGLIADMALENTAADGALSAELTHGRHELAAPPAGHDGHSADNL